MAISGCFRGMQVTPPPDLPFHQFAEGLARFGLDASCARDLGRSQNFVYTVSRQGNEYIARISTGRHRTKPEIEAELAWVLLLAQKGMPVCEPMRSINSQWCEEMMVDGVSFLISVFMSAPGRKPERTEITAAFAYRMGKLIGRMHSISRWATLSGVSFRRNDWRNSRLLTGDMTATDAPVGECFRMAVQTLIDRIAACPIAPTTFGLIHGDLNSGNCHVDGDQLWLFDFDNCEYGYFLQDLSVMLYDTIYSKHVKYLSLDDLNTKVWDLWGHLMAGYRSEGLLLKFQAEELRASFLLREAVIYIHLHRIFPAAQLAMDNYLDEMRAHVEKMSHPLDFDRLARV